MPVVEEALREKGCAVRIVPCLVDEELCCGGGVAAALFPFFLFSFVKLEWKLEFFFSCFRSWLV